MVKQMADKKKWLIAVGLVIAFFFEGCTPSPSLPQPSSTGTAISSSPGIASPSSTILTPFPALPTPTLNISPPNISPFGIIYLCGRPPGALCLARFPNGESERLTGLPTSGLVTDFAVSPNHREVLYTRQSPDSFAAELWHVHLNSLSSQPVMQFHPPRAINGLAWSPTSDRVAYIVSPLEAATVPTERDELWLLLFQGGQPEQIIPENPDGTVGWRWPYWSRDGRFLFVNRFSSGEETQLTEQSVLYALEMSTHRLHWIARGMRVLDQTQDGKRLLLMGYGNGSSQLWVLDWPLSGSPVLLTPAGRSDAQAHWSSDGAQILLASGQVNAEGIRYQIWLMKADGSHRQALTQGPDTLPQWLAGGGDRYVLFLRQRLGTSSGELHLLDLNTHQVWSLNHIIISGSYTSVPLP